MKFRKKPVVIEASQFRFEELPVQNGDRAFMGYPVRTDEKGHFLIIQTLEGPMRANDGDWIVTGVRGERYPVRPDIFEATYEAAV